MTRKTLTGCGRAGFSPLSISGLALWLKADAGLYQESTFTTPAVSDGDPVGGWQDQSGNGRHLLEATSNKRLTLKLAIQNGRSIVRSDGVDDRMTFTAAFAQTAPIHFYAAYANTDGATGYRAFLQRTGGTAPAFYSGGAAGSLRPTTYWNAATLAYGSDVSGFHVVRWRITSGTDIGIQVDGGTEVTSNPAQATLATWTGILLDTVQQLAADFGELLLYQGVTIDAPQDALIRAYLQGKWGTP